jgi:hypothetical protein
MSRKYTVTFDNVAVAAAQDLFELTPADDKPVRIYGLFVGQFSQEGDALEDYFRWACIRGHTTGGSGGSAPTPRPIDGSAGAAAGFAAEVNNTTIASAGTTHTLHADSFNIRTGLPLWLPEGSEWGASQADTTIVVRLLSTPDASTTCSGTLYVEELS